MVSQKLIPEMVARTGDVAVGVFFLLFLIICPIAVYVVSPGTVRVVVEIGSLLITAQGVLVAFAALGGHAVQRKLILPWATASLLLGLLTLMFAIMYQEIPSETVSLISVKAAFAADLIIFAFAVLILYVVVVHWTAGKDSDSTSNGK